jgi:hypothetical protein
MRIEEAALRPPPAGIIVFCRGVAVSLMVSFVEFVHGSRTLFRIVTAIKSKERCIRKLMRALAFAASSVVGV